jgi:hypothetical protein
MTEEAKGESKKWAAIRFITRGSTEAAAIWVMCIVQRRLKHVIEGEFVNQGQWKVGAMFQMCYVGYTTIDSTSWKAEAAKLSKLFPGLGYEVRYEVLKPKTVTENVKDVQMCDDMIA